MSAEELQLRVNTVCMHIPAHAHTYTLFRCVRKIASCLSALLSVCPPASPHDTTRLPLNRFSLTVKFEYFAKISRKSKFYSNLKRITGTLDKYQYTILIISRKILPIMLHIKAVEKTHASFSNFFLF
jgi:hypothetical protein